MFRQKSLVMALTMIMIFSSAAMIFGHPGFVLNNAGAQPQNSGNSVPYSLTITNSSHFRRANEPVRYLPPHSSVYRFQDISGISFDTSSGYLFVSNGPLGTITVYNPSEATVVGYINGSSSFGNSIYDPQNNLLYVEGGSSNLLVINCTTYQFVKDITGFSPGPGAMALDASNGMLYIKAQTKSQGYIYAIDTDNNTIARKITGLLPGNSIAYDFQDQMIYTIQNNNTIASLDTSNYVVDAKAIVLQNEPQHSSPYSLVYFPDKNYLCVGEFSYIFTGSSIKDTTSLQTIDLFTGNLINTTSTSSQDFTVNYAGSGIYDQFTHNVVMTGMDSLFFKNATTGFLQHLSKYSTSPGEMAVNPENGIIYSYLSSQLMEINGNGTNLSYTGNTFQDPTAITYDSNNNNLYVANNYGSTLSVINASTDIITGTLGNVTHPYQIQYDPYWNYLLVTNEYYSFANYVANTSIINPSTGKIVHMFNERIVAGDSETGDYYLGHGNSVSVVSGTNWSNVENISLNSKVSMVYSDQQAGYMVIGTSLSMYILNGKTNSVVNSFSIPGNGTNSSQWWFEGPTEMVTGSSGIDAFVFTPYDGLWNVNLSTGKTNWIVYPMLGGYELITYDPHDNYVYACNDIQEEVYVFNSTTGQQIATLSVPASYSQYTADYWANSVFYNPKTNGVYATLGNYQYGGGALNILNFTYVVVNPPGILYSYKVPVTLATIAVSAVSVFFFFRKKYIP